jgi:N-acyl-D-amino-acid deacylase
MKKFGIIVLCFGILAFVFFNLRCKGKEVPYDLIITEGKIINGEGNPWFRADVAIKGDKIVAIGHLDETLARKVINARGLIVAPGFIDVHTHCDRGIAQIPTADNYLLQGVTTVVGGNCGGHPFPLAELFKKLEKTGISLNFACLIGHNTIRRQVMGYKMEAPTPEEMTEMKRLIENEMKAGAVGFSTGLAYLPGIYSTTEEIVELASAIAPYGGIYASHIRDQGDKITEAIEEAIAIGERNGLPVLISHVKLAKDSVWGELERITRPVEEARRRGVEVFLDQYPYTATSSGFTSSFPSWAFEGGREKFVERLQDPEQYRKIKDFIIARRLTSARGIDKLETIYIAYCEKFREYEGKNLKQILQEKRIKPTVEAAADLIIEIEKNGGAQGVFFQMDEKDVAALMRLPYLMHASDGGIQQMGRGVPHPRNYGTFPRVIARYVREKHILRLEEAIRKMTSLPAQMYRLSGRGLIAVGMYADLTIFDPARFKDKATFDQPHQYSEGLEYVIVNGTVVVEHNRHTGQKPGRILYGPGRRKEASR